MPLLTKYSKTKEYDNPLFIEPESTEELFPIKALDNTGIFTLNDNKYSKTYELSDINFKGITTEEQKIVIIKFSKVLNSLSCRFSFTVANDYVDDVDFAQGILYKLRGDKADHIRECFNDVIRDKVTDARQGLYQKIYLTLTIEAKSLDEVKQLFYSVESQLSGDLITIGVNGIAGSNMRTLGTDERLQLWYNLTHAGYNSGYKINSQNLLKRNKDWLDIVSPESISFYNDYFIMNGNKYGRVMYISKHPQTLDSEIISELAKLNATNYISINSEILNMAGYQREIMRKNDRVGMKIESQKRGFRRNNDYLSDASDRFLRDKSKLEDLSNVVKEADDRFFNTTIMIMFLADDMAELNKITDSVVAIGGLKSFDVKVCFNKQREGINSTFMFGAQEFKRCTNFSAPCLAMFIPFKTQELKDEKGIYYGINKFSLNPIKADRKKLSAPHGLVFGSTGSGKSVYSKCEIISTKCVYPEDNIIIVDPNNEYKDISNMEGMDGIVISFDTKDRVFVNPMDVSFKDVDYGTMKEIIKDKSDFIITLISSCMRRELDSKEEGIIDAAVEQVYSENYSLRKRLNGETDVISEYSVPSYMRISEHDLPIVTNMDDDEQVRRYSPTLQDVYQKLTDMENDKSARELANSMTIFINGSLDYFNHRTNVDLKKKFIVFNTMQLKDNLITPTMLNMIEIIRNKLRTNFANGEWTHVYFDEFHNFLKMLSISGYIVKTWKEARKFYGILTGITQNVTDLINNTVDSANLTQIFLNTNYYAILGMQQTDKNLLSHLLPEISPAMFNHVRQENPGTGLIKMGAVTVPFDAKMDTNCELYSYVNTSKKEQNEE